MGNQFTKLFVAPKHEEGGNPSGPIDPDRLQWYVIPELGGWGKVTNIQNIVSN